MTQKYAEGYPGYRFYQGCRWVDEVEDLARRRARRLFKAGRANVQPHSGSAANMAVYFAALEPGDTVLALDLASGGHLTHGDPVNFSAQLYNFVHYGVDPETEQIDYNQVARLAREHRPKMIVTGATAYPDSGTMHASRRLPTTLGQYIWRTWHTSPASWPVEYIHRRCPMPST